MKVAWLALNLVERWDWQDTTQAKKMVELKEMHMEFAKAVWLVDLQVKRVLKLVSLQVVGMDRMWVVWMEMKQVFLRVVWLVDLLVGEWVDEQVDWMGDLSDWLEQTMVDYLAFQKVVQRVAKLGQLASNLEKKLDSQAGKQAEKLDQLDWMLVETLVELDQNQAENLVVSMAPMMGKTLEN